MRQDGGAGPRRTPSNRAIPCRSLHLEWAERAGGVTFVSGGEKWCSLLSLPHFSRVPLCASLHRALVQVGILVSYFGACPLTAP